MVPAYGDPGNHRRFDAEFLYVPPFSEFSTTSSYKTTCPWTSSIHFLHFRYATSDRSFQANIRSVLANTARRTRSICVSGNVFDAVGRGTYHIRIDIGRDGTEECRLHGAPEPYLELFPSIAALTPEVARMPINLAVRSPRFVRLLVLLLIRVVGLMVPVMNHLTGFVRMFRIRIQETLLQRLPIFDHRY